MTWKSHCLTWVMFFFLYTFWMYLMKWNNGQIQPFFITAKSQRATDEIRSGIDFPSFVIFLINYETRIEDIPTDDAVTDLHKQFYTANWNAFCQVNITCKNKSMAAFSHLLKCLEELQLENARYSYGWNKKTLCRTTGYKRKLFVVNPLFPFFVSEHFKHYSVYSNSPRRVTPQRYLVLQRLALQLRCFLLQSVNFLLRSTFDLLSFLSFLLPTFDKVAVDQHLLPHESSSDSPFLCGTNLFGALTKFKRISYDACLAFLQHRHWSFTFTKILTG